MSLWKLISCLTSVKIMRQRNGQSRDLENKYCNKLMYFHTCRYKLLLIYNNFISLICCFWRHLSCWTLRLIMTSFECEEQCTKIKSCCILIRIHKVCIIMNKIFSLTSCLPKFVLKLPIPQIIYNLTAPQFYNFVTFYRKFLISKLYT